MATVQRALSPRDARRLAEHLLGNARSLPVVVVSAGGGEGGPDGLISAETVADGVGELAEVWWIPTGDPTWEFKAAMPSLTQVFGDAARVYDLSNEWRTNAYASKLYMCGTRDKARRIEEDLVADAMEAAAKAGLLAKRVAKARVVTAEVRGIPAPGRAIVRGDFGFATIRAELVVSGLPIERLVVPGMTVSGPLDERDMLVDLTDSVRRPETALADYAVGDTVLARVSTVGRSVVAVELYPGKVVEIRATQVTGDSDDDLRDLMSLGEVVAVRVERTGSWILSMLDVDEHLPPRTCSLLEGGPAWLAETLPVAEEPVTEAPVPAAPVEQPPEAGRAPSPGPRPAPPGQQVREGDDALRREQRLTESLRSEITQRGRAMDALEAELASSRRLIEHLKTRQRQLISKARKGRGTADPREVLLFADGEQQLRHDVYLAWVAKIPAGEKRDKEMPDDWLVGPEFCASLRQVQPEIRDKIPGVIVEVILGIANKSAGREMHVLRSSEGGGSPAVIRADGAVCWRVAVQRSAPSAARLHFWRRPGGPVELSRVVLHDDMRP